MTFGKWLKDKRKEARMTQETLAAKARLSTSYISALERHQPHSTTDAEPQPSLTARPHRRASRKFTTLLPTVACYIQTLSV